VTPEQTKIFSATCSPPGIPGDSLYQKDLGTGDFIFIEEMKEKHGYDAEVDRAILLDALSNNTMMT
jgi:hypothetical protein